MRKLILSILIVGGVIWGVLGQGDAETPERAYHTVDLAVLARHVDSGGLPEWTLRFSGERADCGALETVTQQVAQGWLSVEVFFEHEDDFGAPVVCGETPVSYEITLPVDELFSADLERFRKAPEEILVVEINTYIGVLNPVWDESLVVPGAPPPDKLVLRPTEREPLFVESVTVNTRQLPVEVTLAGVHPNGCYMPPHARYTLHEDSLDIEVYRPALPETDIACPEVILEYTLVLVIDEPLGRTPYTYRVNDEVRGAFTMGASTDDPMFRSLHLIESVDVLLLESFPVQVNLRVQGYIRDGCQFPTQVETRQVDDVIYVEIFREVPPDVMCPMVMVGYEDVIPLGAIDPGTYTLDINGVVVRVEVR